MSAFLRSTDEGAGQANRPPNRGNGRPTRGPGSRLDVDADGIVSDADLSAATPPQLWARVGLRGPAIVFHWCTRNALRLLVLIVGIAVLAAGVAMLVLPGPGLIVMFFGLAILASEFAWAERMLDRTRDTAVKTAASLSNSRSGRAVLVVGGVSMIVTGIIAGTVFASWVMGIAAIVGGVIALASLHPSVIAKFAAPDD